METAKEKFKIEYLSAAKNFKFSVKEFDSYEDAKKWGKENLPNFNTDMIKLIHQ